MSNAKPLDENTFKSETAAGVVLVDFWAEWCMPCKLLAPVLDELAADYAGKAVIAKVNVDDAPGLAQEFGVSSIPTLVLMKDGSEVNRFVGRTPKATLSGALDAVLV